MNSRNEYNLLTFTKNKDGSAWARINADDFTMLVEARLLKEDGEDPLAIVDIYHQYTRVLDGEKATVVIDAKDGDITEDSIHEAIQEFMSGAR